MKGVWNAIQHASNFSSSTADANFLLLDTFPSEHNQRLTTTLWSLWKHINLKVWDDVTEVCAIVVKRTKAMVEDWQLANATRVADTGN